MASYKQQQYKKIKTYMEKFKPSHLPYIINHVIKNVSWEAVKKDVARANACLSSSNISYLVFKALEARNFDVSIVEDILVQLQLYDMATSKTHKWCAAQLLEKSENVSMEDLNNLKRSIIRSYRIHALNIECYTFLRDGIIWLATVEKKITKKNGVRNSTPSFFVLKSDLLEPHVFFYPRSIYNRHSFMLFLEGLGYKDSKFIDLSGRDPASLFAMLNRKYDQNSDHFVPDFTPAPFMLKEDDLVVDYTLGREREKYAEELFKEPTNLQEYVVEAKNHWRGTRFIPDLSGTKVKMTLTFSSTTRGRSVEDIFKGMISSGMVNFPVPKYMANFSYEARNKLKIRKLQKEANN